MKSRGLLSVGEHAGWEIIFDYGATQNAINGVTTLFSFTDFSDFSALALFVEDQDAVNGVRAVLDRSHGGSLPCDDLQRFSDIAASKEGCAQAEYSNPGGFARGQIVNSSGSTVVVRWALLGKRRA